MSLTSSRSWAIVASGLDVAGQGPRAWVVNMILVVGKE
jgi:hypothetical protein